MSTLNASRVESIGMPERVSGRLVCRLPHRRSSWRSAVAGARSRLRPLGPSAADRCADDPEFASLVKQWTTKPEFLSPLVDHLPKKPGVPTPKDILGYYVGAPNKLTYTADQQRYFRTLEKALPGRVRTMVAGKTEEGRDILVAFISSEANLKNLEANRQNLKKLADPRGLSDADVQKLLASTKPHYHVSAGLHSAETSPPESVLELGYRLAVSEEPYIRQIRDNVIVSIAPSTDLDGRDRAVDWYYAYKVNELPSGGENYGGPPYWGKYVFHDNNRDINYGVDSLRAHLNWYLNWVPPIWHDLHEAQTLLYTFSGQPPQNANLDPILYTELPFFATYEVNKLTSYGMPGVWHFGFVDTWSPGYLGFAASNHNGMLRMYEIFNQGGATTKKARLQGAQTTREWYRPFPAPVGEIDWSIRNSVNYAVSGVLTALELTSKFPSMVVENFYKKTVNSIQAGQTKAPYAIRHPGRPEGPDAGRSRGQPAAAPGHRGPQDDQRDDDRQGSRPNWQLCRQAQSAVRSPRENAAREADLSGSELEDLRRQRVDDGAGEQRRRQDVRRQGHSRRPGPVALRRRRNPRRHRRHRPDVRGPPQRLAQPDHARYRLKNVAVKAAKAVSRLATDEYPSGSFIISPATR